MRQYSQLFFLGLQIWISEMLQYYPELEVVELVQDGPRFFWDHLLPSMQTLTSAGGHFEFSNGTNRNNTC
jgi:hypothetical protein